MKNIVCSIIVPMYNESNNLVNCLKAIQNQTYSNFEAIFIDDGSTDNTVEKLTKLLKDCDFSYQVLRQSNKGAAAAREYGISSAKGSYVCILDCDDSISEDAIEKAIEMINTHNADISVPQLYVEDEKGHHHKFNFFDNTRLVFTGDECLINSLGEWKMHGFTVCKKKIFFKSYIMYKEKNNEGKNYINNDEVISRLNFYNAKVVTVNSGSYYYKYNSNSTTKRINLNRYLILYNEIIIHDLFKKDFKVYDNVDRELFNWLSAMIRYYLKYYKEITNKKQWKAAFKTTFKELIKRNIFWKLRLRAKIKLFKRFLKAIAI